MEALSGKVTWLAVDKDGMEHMFRKKPVRDEESGKWVSEDGSEKGLFVPKGTAKITMRLFFKKNETPTWDNDPIEVKMGGVKR